MAYRVSYRSGSGFNLGPIGFLIITNMILYVATSIKPDLFISLFGFRPANVLQMPWTIITSMFIHSPFSIRAPFSSIWHILGNMLTLYFLGSYLIRFIGEKKFLIVYFIGGIIGNLFFLLSALVLQAYLFSIVFGASGAVAAVCGSLIAIRPRLKVVVIPIPVPVPLWVVGILVFVILSVIVPGIAWQAHLGGLIFGLIMGYMFKKRLRGIIFNF